MKYMTAKEFKKIKDVTQYDIPIPTITKMVGRSHVVVDFIKKSETFEQYRDYMRDFSNKINKPKIKESEEDSKRRGAISHGQMIVDRLDQIIKLLNGTRIIEEIKKEKPAQEPHIEEQKTFFKFLK